MVPASTETEQPAVLPTLEQFLGLPTGAYRVELEWNFGSKESPLKYRLSIEVPTFQDVRGILAVASAKLFDTVLPDQSNGV